MIYFSSQNYELTGQKSKDLFCIPLIDWNAYSENLKTAKPPISYKHECIFCHKEFFTGRKKSSFCSGICCSSSTRKVSRPSYEELQKELSAGTWESVAKKYGVSSNAVRKWVSLYNKFRSSLD